VKYVVLAVISAFAGFVAAWLLFQAVTATAPVTSKRVGTTVTTPARTLLDLGECLGLRELEQALARAERNCLVTRDEVRAMVRRHPQHRGARLLRRLLGVEGPSAYTRSRAEELLLALIRRARLRCPS